MAAGVSNWPWEVADIAALIEVAEAKKAAAKHGPYKKKPVS